MSNEVAQTAAQLPAHLQGVVGTELYDELSGGVSSGFGVISYKGKVWRVKLGGEEQAHVNEEGEALGSIEVVLLRSNELPSKTFYQGAYSEGDQAKPDCWSSSGIRPDSTVPEAQRISALCASCPNNVWGSKITDQGKQTKACADVRRVAVAMEYQIAELAAGVREMADVDVMLLRVPAASLNPLKEYAEGVLKPKGIPFYVLVTKIGFDVDAPYPKFTFKGLRFLNEDEFKAASLLRESDDAKRVLNESTEYADEGTTGANGQAGAAVTPAAPDAVAPAPPKATKAPKKQPAQPVEETAVEVEATAAQADVIDDIAPAPPVTAKSDTVASPATEAPAPAEGDPDFNAMLDSILG